MMSAVLSNPNHPEYGVATIPFPIPHDQYFSTFQKNRSLVFQKARCFRHSRPF